MITKPCATCAHWKPTNRNMGHCRYPLPASIRELIGPVIAKNGHWIWVEQVLNCSTYAAQQAPASRLDYLFACYEHNWSTTKRNITCPHCAQQAQEEK